MQGINQGLVSYPNVDLWESFTFTDVSGITPAIATMTIFPQGVFPEPNGDMLLTYNGNLIVIANMHLDSMSYERGSGGKTVTVRFLDERWKWKDASITLRANIVLPSGWVDPNHEWTPQQLATACFQALDVEVFDVSALPNDARPNVDWDHANPAQELAKICDDLGCRIVPVRSIGGWQICVTGIGNDLPSDLPFNDAGDGIDPKETPDFIKIVSAPILYQYAVALEPIGKEVDLSWEPLSTLSYRKSDDATSAYGFGDQALKNFVGTGATRYRMADGTFLSPMELAQQTVLRAWRIYDPAPYGQFSIPPQTSRVPNNGSNAAQTPNQASINIPGFPYPVFRKQIILTNQLVQSYTDAYGEDHKRPSFIFGLYRGDKCTGGGNYPFGRRIDSQVNNVWKISLEEQQSFSLAVDPNDSDKSIIMISKPMIRVTNPAAVQSLTQAAIFGAAKLWFMTAVQVRDFNTWQPVRNEFYYQIGDGTNYDFCQEVIQNDIQPYYITTYPGLSLASDGVSLNPGTTTDNYDQVLQQSLYYAQSIAQTYQTVQTATRTYIGLFPIDMDGAIQQITYRIGKDGASTIASKNTEHDFDIPDYWARRRRDANFGVADKIKVQQEIQNQRDALRGNFNT